VQIGALLARKENEMNRIIINYSDEISAGDAVKCVKDVIEMGRISGDCFCYVTNFKTTGDDIIVLSSMTETGTDSFRVAFEREVTKSE